MGVEKKDRYLSKIVGGRSYRKQENWRRKENNMQYSTSLGKDLTSDCRRQLGNTRVGRRLGKGAGRIALTEGCASVGKMKL